MRDESPLRDRGALPEHALHLAALQKMADPGIGPRLLGKGFRQGEVAFILLRLALGCLIIITQGGFQITRAIASSVTQTDQTEDIIWINR